MKNLKIIMTVIPFTLPSKAVRYLGINSSKEFHERLT